MKKLIIAVLVFSVLFNASFSALAFDKAKLLELKPLVSERLDKMVEKYESTKVFQALGFGALGAVVMSANNDPGIDPEIRVYDQTMGYLFLLLAADVLITPGIYEIDRKVIRNMGLTGADKELSSYFIFKDYAEKNKSSRTTMGITLVLWGIGSMLIAGSSNDIRSDYRTAINAVSALSIVIGALSYFLPSDIEMEAGKIDSEMAL